MHCNEDTYQLKIRQYVVENLGKDINSLLTFSFRKYGSKTVCAIAVPSYHMVVKLHNTVYQRQGNATRPLESKNVKLLIQRKKGNGLTNKAPYPLFPEDPNYYSNQDRIFSGNENALDKIPTSLFHSYSLHKGYFSIIENNKYILTEGLQGSHCRSLKIYQIQVYYLCITMAMLLVFPLIFYPIKSLISSIKMP